MNIKEIKKVIRIYVNQADPWYLIESGAPLDEYNYHVDRIVSILINKKPSLDQLVGDLEEIFKTIEHDLDTKKIRELAQKIKEIEL